MPEAEHHDFHYTIWCSDAGYRGNPLRSQRFRARTLQQTANARTSRTKTTCGRSSFPDLKTSRAPMLSSSTRTSKSPVQCGTVKRSPYFRPSLPNHSSVVGQGFCTVVPPTYLQIFVYLLRHDTVVVPDYSTIEWEINVGGIVNAQAHNLLNS
jgi:hypothetical protein